MTSPETSLEQKFQSLKQNNKLSDEVNQVLKDKQAIYKPSINNSGKILNSFVFPRSVNDFVGNKIPNTKDATLMDLISYNFYHLILVLIFLIYSAMRGIQYSYRRIRLRFLELLYNPSQSPELIRQDINKLDKIPRRLSTIVSLKSESEEGGGIDGLLNDTAEIISWSIASGIPSLTIFEYNGILKTKVPNLVSIINKSLINYFGNENLPTFSIKIPRYDITTFGNGKSSSINYLRPNQESVDIEIILISNKDGKKTIGDLARTMAELASKNELNAKDITIDLIDSELSDLSGQEPDLLILFGSELDLQGYPPWQIRLSEIYWEEDNDNVNYVVFLNALKKFSTCKVNIGK